MKQNNKEIEKEEEEEEEEEEKAYLGRPSWWSAWAGRVSLPQQAGVRNSGPVPISRLSSWKENP
jgi:hypothetical protein